MHRKNYHFSTKTKWKQTKINTMPTVIPENNKFIYSRIVFELADAIKAADNNMLHIDDAIIVAATPAVLLN